MKIKLITDSMCNLTEEFAKEHNIGVVKLSTLLDDITREEGPYGKWDEFYNALENTKSFPKTSQPSPANFEEEFRQAFQDGYDEVLVITMASMLSGTINSARLSAEVVNAEHIHIVDSHSVSLGEHLIVEKALDLIAQGINIHDIVKELETYRQDVTIDFLPVTMEYLKRGGRVSGVLATIANVLNLKPVLCFKNNTLTNVKKVLGMMKGIAEIVARIPQHIKNAYVLYVHKSEFLQKFIDQLKLKRPDMNLRLRGVGPTLGSHIGIGAIGIAY